MEEHWRAGYHDAVRTLRHPEVLQRPGNQDGVCTFDLAVRRAGIAAQTSSTDLTRDRSQEIQP